MAPALILEGGCLGISAVSVGAGVSAIECRSSSSVECSMSSRRRHSRRHSYARIGQCRQQQQARRRRRGVLVLSNAASSTSDSMGNPSSESHFHTVKQGESWYSISERFGVTIDDLYKANGVAKRNKMLYVDSRVIVPVASSSTPAPLALKGISPGDSVALYLIGTTAAATAAVTLIVIKLKDSLQKLRSRRQAVAVVQPPEGDRQRYDDNGAGLFRSRIARETSSDEEEGYRHPLTDGYWVKHPSTTNGVPSASTFVWGSHSSNPFLTQQMDQQHSNGKPVSAITQSVKSSVDGPNGFPRPGKTRPYTSSSLAQVFAEQLELLERMLNENLAEMDELKDGAANRISSSTAGNAASGSDIRGLVAADCLFQAAALREAMEDSLRHLDDAEDFLKDQLETLRDATLNQYLARMSKLMDQAQQNLKELEYLTVSGALSQTEHDRDYREQRPVSNGNRKVESRIIKEDTSLSLQQDFEELMLLQKENMEASKEIAKDVSKETTVNSTNKEPVVNSVMEDPTVTGAKEANKENEFRVNGFNPQVKFSHSWFGRQVRSMTRKSADGSQPS